LQQDTLADALTTIKNAEDTGKSECTLRPASKIIASVLTVFKEEGYIDGFEYVEDGKAGLFHVNLLGNINRCGVVRPRYAVKMEDFERYEERFLPSRTMGLLVVTTSSGVMSHSEAKRQGMGGQILAYVF
jgi:small subunit ribosomal protein S8